ncbi:MAG: hypothetical protein SGJ10_01140, partial [Bacteroidota bacterium]|nr:hypothetical protein [Bacteroidota bacterium]
YHVYQPLQYILLSLIYYEILGGVKFYRLYFYISIIIFIAFCIVNLFFLQTLYSFPSNSLLLCAVFLLPQILLLYVEMIDRPASTSLKNQSVFWFNTGNLLFQSIMFLIWGFFNIFKNTGSMPNFLPITIIIINLLYYGCLSITLYLEKKQTTLVNI